MENILLQHEKNAQTLMWLWWGGGELYSHAHEGIAFFCHHPYLCKHDSL